MEIGRCLRLRLSGFRGNGCIFIVKGSFELDFLVFFDCSVILSYFNFSILYVILNIIIIIIILVIMWIIILRILLFYMLFLILILFYEYSFRFVIIFRFLNISIKENVRGRDYWWRLVFRNFGLWVWECKICCCIFNLERIFFWGVNNFYIYLREVICFLE